jgi:dUTP pyrophosphatase
MDVYANIPSGEEIIIGPGDYKTIPVGIATVIPDGFDISLRGRSGLAFKNGIICHFGTIDADYRGEYGVIMFNLGKKAFAVKGGDRIGQVVLHVVPKIRWIEVDRLEDVSLINRGGGYGSTGTN